MISLLLRQDVDRTTNADAIVLIRLGRALKVNGTNPVYQCALKLLETEKCSHEQIGNAVAEAFGEGAIAQWEFFRARLDSKNFLERSLLDGERCLATILPKAPGLKLENRPPITRSFVLSRFCCLRPEKDGLVLESPLAGVFFILRDSVMAVLVAELSREQNIAAFVKTAEQHGLSQQVAAECLALLRDARLLTEILPDGSRKEDEDPALRQMEAHDLIFHERSRFGRHEMPIGATYPFGDSEERNRVVIEREATIELPRPDLEKLKETDPSFTEVLEARTSVRVQGDKPLSVEELGEFLYRTARIKQLFPAVSELGYEASKRPHASGGACYPLEIYLTVNRCQGLEPGFYRYDPLHHRLGKVELKAETAEVFLDWAMRATGMEKPPQIVFLFAARIARVSWKYRSIAYTVLLKDVGALIQTMYLTATAMGLAPCAMGSGSTMELSAVTGQEWFREMAVGEFVLGSRPAKETSPRDSSLPPDEVS